MLDLAHKVQPLYLRTALPVSRLVRTACANHRFVCEPPPASREEEEPLPHRRLACEWVSRFYVEPL